MSKLTPDLIAEASAWLAILHGPNRTAATERGFSTWLNTSDLHAKAFEEATGIWEEARALSPRPLPRSPGEGRGGGIWLAAASIAVVAFGAILYTRNAGISTNIGEQRVLALEDGTRVVLNTDTRIVVSYGRDRRRIELKEGEALFEVARKANWPFIVQAGDRTIEALGTSFVVRRDARQLAVTLVEGKIAVSDVVMAPGERLIFAEKRIARKDHPQVEKLLAWQRREVALDDAALPAAVAEMNRYNRVPLVLDAADAAQMRVTGLFRAGDSLSFARAVAEAYKLEVTEEPGRIMLHRN